MNRSDQHPEDLQLLRYADGELQPREARRVRRHLETCWECRTELEEIERTISDCVRYRKNILQPNLPSPPAPWMDIQAAFSRLDATPGRVSFFSRLFLPLRQVMGNRWLIPAAVAALAVCGIYFEFRQTPSVQAAELLRKAVAAETSKPRSPARRIRIRTRTAQLTRVVGRTVVQKSRDAAAAEAKLAGLFQSAHYDWDDPLSARSYGAWRDQLAQKHDEVQSLDGQSYEIRTTTEQGELAAASLKLRGSDLQAIEGRLEFRNHDWVEMAEMPGEIPTAPQVSATLPEVAPTPAAPSSGEPNPAPASGPGASEELQVLAALHNLGADLGDPVEVSRSSGSIVVSGVGVAQQRQQQIKDAVRDLPHVVVRFAEPAAPAETPSVEQSIESPPTSDGLRFQQRLEQQLGGRALLERYNSQLLDLNEALMSRAYALRRLAQRFAPGSESQLDPESRRTLLRMAREHAAALGQAERGLEHLLTPVLTSLGGAPLAVQQNIGSSHAWQPATEELFRNAHSVETLLASMLDVSPRSGSNQELPSRLLTGLAQLRAGLENYTRLLSQDPGGDIK